MGWRPPMSRISLKPETVVCDLLLDLFLPVERAQARTATDRCARPARRRPVVAAGSSARRIVRSEPHAMLSRVSKRSRRRQARINGRAQTRAVSPTRQTDPELDGLIDGVTADCNDEDEQLSGFDNAFDDANFPRLGTVVRERVEVDLSARPPVDAS